MKQPRNQMVFGLFVQRSKQEKSDNIENVIALFLVCGRSFLTVVI